MKTKKVTKHFHYSSYAIKEGYQYKNINKQSNLKNPHSSAKLSNPKLEYSRITSVVRQQCYGTLSSVLKLCLTSATQACLALYSVALPRRVGAEAICVSPEVILLSAAKSQRSEDVRQVFHSWQWKAETRVYAELWNPTAHGRESTSQSP